MALTFKKATKAQSKLRLAIAGPAGSGKTYTALKLATEIGGKIAFIDTERGSASKYADVFDFDVIELDDFHPDRYIEAMKAAEKGGYAVLIIDSTTHEWNGKNGILELHEAAVQRQRTKNGYTAWAEVTPLHNRFIDAILQSKCHVIASVRSKTDYVQDKDERGKTEIRKVGMKSEQREGMDYEYDIMIEMSVDHVGVITKTRCAELDGKTFKKPGAELAEILNRWLTDGSPPQAPKLEIVPTIDDWDGARAELKEQLRAMWPKSKNPADFEPYFNKKFAKVSTDDLRIQVEGAKEQAARLAKAAQERHEMEAAGEVIDAENAPMSPADIIDTINARIATLAKLTSEKDANKVAALAAGGEELEELDIEALSRVLEALDAEIEKPR